MGTIMKKSEKRIKASKRQLVNPLSGEIVTNDHKGQLLCIYAPVSWPFMHKGFVKNFLRVIHPANIVQLKKWGITDYFPLLHDSFPVDRNRNEAAFVAQMYNASWIMFLDSDMTFPPDIIPQLMSHQQPIVAGMYFHKSRPHMPVIYNKKGDKPHVYDHVVSYPKYDLFEVDMTGMGCMLVNTEVFSKMEMPYFGYQSTREDGLMNVTEDVLFCQKAKQAGYKIMIDPMVKCNHIRTEEVTENHFDVYMQTYKSAQKLLDEFGDTNLDND